MFLNFMSQIFDINNYTWEHNNAKDKIKDNQVLNLLFMIFSSSGSIISNYLAY